ncbi:thymidylate kinase [Paenibacillus popilliae ATCC 14706]|uniref:Thymidylate kinase n=2 Tax=Paenibacillus popilliae TaxID=78057 RepID=M9LPF7_PAEPP|nr:thymidylate kinase [Paenibacillus popilliae ATCC 14706]
MEGGEGAGKTTAMHKLAQRLEERGLDVVMTREPGGIVISEQIRSLILDPAHVSMDPRTEALLYAAARRQHLVERIEPALQRGSIVLCDRFVDSSLAYQGYARGIGMEEVWDINRFAVHYAMPDITIWFDIDPEEGLERIRSNRCREVNRLDTEQLAFHKAVRQGYERLARQYPDRIVCVDASHPKTVIQEQIFDILSERTQDFGPRMCK